MAVRPYPYKATLWIVCGLTAPMLVAAEGGPLSPKDNQRRAAVAPEQTATSLEFNIPAQPLAAALDQYAAVSGQSALFSSALVANRESSAVSGRYPPEKALRTLLTGSGLSADKISKGRITTFMLTPVAANARPLTTSPALPDRLTRYDGQVQAHIWQALCDNPLTIPGNYRSLLRFQIDSAGRIRRARLIGSSGNGYRDAALLTTLQQVQVGQPPQSMAQPLTMLILPQDKIAGQACRPGRP